jgi:NAD(P)-dependent dehydrogenase (short-subunit alcohol dehydrogenase family)
MTGPAPADRRRASAIVTGGAGGLGGATTRHLVAAGMRVVVVDRSARRAGELVAELVADDGDAAAAVVGDVEDDATVHEAIGAAGAVRLLVNAAGGGLGGEPTLEADGTPHDLDSFRRTMARNAVGTFNACRLVAAAMATNPPDDEGQRGVLVNTASVAGYEGQIGQVAYASAKAAVLAMTLPMARDLSSRGIRVCAIAPGPMATAAMQHLDESVRADLVRDIPFPKRMGRPEEFARLVEAIATNPYLNGENIRLDGAVRLPPA